MPQDLGLMYARIQADTSQLKKAEGEIKAFSGNASGLFSKSFLGFTLGAAAATKSIQMIKQEFMFGLKAVEDFGMTVAKSTALITTFSARAKKGDLQGAFIEANKYAKDLSLTLEIMDSRTIATGRDLQAMSETFIAQGVLLDINNKKQVDGFTSVANALSILTEGQNKDIQMRQEIRGLMDGKIRQEDKLGMLLKAQIPDIEKQLKLWQKEGTVLEHLGGLLEGFNAITGLLQDQWATVGTTMETIHTRVLRGMMEPVFKDLIKLAKELNATFMDSEGNLTTFARGLVKVANEGYDGAKRIGNAYADIATKLGPLGLVIKIVGAEGEWIIEKITEAGMTGVEKTKNEIVLLEKELESMKSFGEKWWQLSIFKDSVSDIEARKNKIAEMYSSIRDSENEMAREKGRMEGGGKTTVPILAPPADDTKSKGRAENWNAVLNAQIAYLKSAEERKMAIILASNSLEQEYNQNAYDLGLSDYQTYLEKKQALTESALQANLDSKKKELSDAEEALGKLSPSTDKQGNVRADKDAQAEFQALQKIEEAKQGVIEAENQLTMARIQGAKETVDKNKEVQNSYKQIEIQLLEMSGKPIEAAKLQAQMDEESIERKQLIEAAINKIAGAQEALDNLRKQSSLEIRNKELDEISRKLQAQQSITEINNEYGKSRDIQIQLLKVEKERAKLNGALKEQIELLDEQNQALEDLKTPIGALNKGWEDATARWRDQALVMQDIARETAQIMQSAFSDFFFDVLEGKLKTVGDYSRSFLRAINQEIANTLAKTVVSNMSGTGSAISGLVGMFGGMFSGGGGTSTSGVNQTWSNAIVEHGGGVVGVDKTTSRIQSTASFSGVPRYHQGLANDEFRAILKRKEMVLTEGQQSTLSSMIADRRPGIGFENKTSNSINVPITVNNAPYLSKEISTELKRKIEKLIVETMKEHS